MYDHIGLRVADLNTSVRFYEAALGGLGYAVCSLDASTAGLGPKDNPILWLYQSTTAIQGGAHVAFRAADHASVNAFHAAGVKAGGCDNGAPGIREDYSANYYAAFLLDPDGNNIEAVCLV